MLIKLLVIIRFMDTEQGNTGPINLGNPNEITILKLAETVLDLLKLALQGQQLRKELITAGAPPEIFPPVKIDLETGKMEFNPEIFPEGNTQDK